MDHQQFLCAALCILTVFEFSVGADTLSVNQTLGDGEVLISPGQTFELGFFSPGSSTARFLGIRYRATPDVVVWVANRERQITSSLGVLALAKNGTLVLSTAQSSNIWSSNITRAASSPVLQLLDSGNLVIMDKAMAGSYVWQSFDHPGDTLLPGMKMVLDPETGEDKHLTSWRSADDPSIGEFSYRIQNQGLSQVITLKGVEKVYRAIFWDGHFPGFPALPYITWKPAVLFERGRLISIFQPFNESVKTRFTMNYSGSTQRYLMNEQEDGWILMITGPRDMCDSYGLCGRNGVCSAYADPYFRNETSCLMWFGDLIDTREQTVEPGGGPNIKTKIIFIAAASSFGMLILASSFGGLLLYFIWQLFQQPRITSPKRT